MARFSLASLVIYSVVLVVAGGLLGHALHTPAAPKVTRLQSLKAYYELDTPARVYVWRRKNS